MSKSKLLYLRMGSNNPQMTRALEYYFDCTHIDWTEYGAYSQALQDVVLHACNNVNPDYVLLHIQSGSVLTIETIKQICKNHKVINWTGDVRHPLPQHYIDIGKEIFLTLYTNMNDIEETRNYGINADFLQVGFDDVQFNPIGNTNTQYQPILFLGSNYQGLIDFPLSDFRRDMVFRLKNEFKDYFGLYGTGWSNGNGVITSYVEECCAYRSCKVAINLSHFDYSRYTSDRMFRIMGSGALCLTHRFHDIEQDFVVGDDLVAWDNLDDLVDKIKHYIANEYERQRIATIGCQLARTKYTWNNFAQNLIQIIKKYE
jgi:spore maturation protein CgeB